MIEMNKSANKMMTERNIERMKTFMSKAIGCKLTSDGELCGFHFLAPRNKRTHTNVYFYGDYIAKIEDGKVDVFNVVVSKHNEWKYNAFKELASSYSTEVKVTPEALGEDVSDSIKTEDKVVASKKKSRKKAVKK